MSKVVAKSSPKVAKESISALIAAAAAAGVTDPKVFAALIEGAGSITASAPAAAPAPRAAGGAGAGRAAGGAGASATPARGTHSSRGGGASRGRPHGRETTARPSDSDAVVDFVSSDVKGLFNKAKTLTDLTKLTYKGTGKKLLWLTKWANPKKTYQCVVIRIHKELIDQICSDRSAHPMTVINAVSQELKSWFEPNNDSVIADIHAKWSDAYASAVLEDADNVFIRKNSFAKGLAVMVGKKSSTESSASDEDVADEE